MFAISSKSKLEQRLSQISSEKIESGPSYETVRDNVRPIAQEKLQQQLGAGFDRHMARAKAKNIIIDLLELHGSHFPKPMQLSMAEELVDDLLGYGPLEVLMNDPDITEIKVVHWNEIWIEKNGVERELQTAFRNEQHCREVLDRLLAASGKSIDYSRPYTSFFGKFSFGYGITVVIHKDGVFVSVSRCTANSPFTQGNNHIGLVEFGSPDAPVADLQEGYGYTAPLLQAKVRDIYGLHILIVSGFRHYFGDGLNPLTAFSCQGNSYQGHLFIPLSQRIL